MEKTIQYMTVEECRIYRKVFEKYEPYTLRMAPSLPCFQLYPKDKDSLKRKRRRKAA